MFFNINKLVDEVKKKNRILRLSILGISTFLLALTYNMFLKPNNLVTGGITGASIICQKLFSIDASFFLYLFSILLILLSFFTLGLKETSKHLVGALLYPIMVSFTLPLANLLNNYFVVDNFIIEVIIVGLIMGLASGMVYKVGYSTGGNDIVVLIMNKYAKVPVGKSNFVSNVIVILLGGAIFGINNVIYAIIIIYIMSAVVDKILLGISNSKQFFIHTKEINKVKELIIKKLGAGVTEIETTGGYLHHKQKMLMCVVSTKDYYLFKEAVKEIDPEAFFVINDCYEVAGGVRRTNLPFI